MLDFGELLKNLRKAAKLTQEQLGDRLHVSKSVICYYEHSRRPPSTDVLIQLSEEFHVSVDYLLGREKKEHTLNLRGLSDKDVEFLRNVAAFLQEKNEEQDQKKNDERDKDTTANF